MLSRRIFAFCVSSVKWHTSLRVAWYSYAIPLDHVRTPHLCNTNKNETFKVDYRDIRLPFCRSYFKWRNPFERKYTCWFLWQPRGVSVSHIQSSHVIKWKTFISTFIKVILFYIKYPPFSVQLLLWLSPKKKKKINFTKWGESLREARGTKKWKIKQKA